MLGSSNKSSGQEVFPCVSATCGHFYHPKCVAKLLHPGDENQAEDMQKKIAAGDSFICPAHKCFKCKQGEDKKVYDLQFALCRRCPKAYHRKCLPRDIVFKGDAARNIHQRAWDGLLPSRILIYCMNHTMITRLGTPERNHVMFPGVDRKKKQLRLKLLSGREEGAEKRRIKLVAENRSIVSESVAERTAVKMQKKFESVSSTGSGSTKRLDQGLSRQGFGSKIPDVTMKSLKANNISVQTKVGNAFKADRGKSSLGNNHSQTSMTRYAAKPTKQGFPSGQTQNTRVALPVMKKLSNTLPPVDAEMEKRIMSLMKKSTASFNMEEFIKEKKKLSSNACSSRYAVDKTITQGRVEASVKAVRAALKKLEEGCAIEEAKEVCEPEILEEIVRWKKKLRVYLAPFLQGMRYTSFGRHFTKVDKLKEIIDRLHWYVRDGDMIVDFCCGSNDFSWFLKEKLEQMGKSCSFRNYDLIQSKNDFNFEKRDWMSVHPEELPEGSQLIMGLNPPFGVEASRANQFIEKALTFKPKLLILIVPRETKRLDEKNPPYDLIWEDDKMLYGKAFYLPGSVDDHDQQLEQWNNKTPPLYLWSRPDWTANHKIIAQQHGHLLMEQEETNANENNVETPVSNYLMEENQDCYGDFSNIMNGCGDISRLLDDVPEDYADDIEHVVGGAKVPGGHLSPILDNVPGDYADDIEHEGGGANVPDDHSISSDELDRLLDEALQRVGQNETKQIRNPGSVDPFQMDDEEMYADLQHLMKTVDEIQQSP